tara:strand:+ start:880 stop:1209 length:330 start_codon:yes stop_codon:yes gene_type:complete
MSDIIFSAEVLTKLDNAVQEAADSLVRQQGEKDLRSEIASMVKEEIGLSTSEFNSLVKERYDDSISEKIAKLEGTVELNEKLTEHRRKNRTQTALPAASEPIDDHSDSE